MEKKGSATKSANNPFDFSSMVHDDPEIKELSEQLMKDTSLCNMAEQFENAFFGRPVDQKLFSDMEQVTDPLVTPVEHLRSAIVKDPVMMQMLKADPEEFTRLMVHVENVSPELMSQMHEESSELKDVSSEIMEKYWNDIKFLQKLGDAVGGAITAETARSAEPPFTVETPVVETAPLSVEAETTPLTVEAETALTAETSITAETAPPAKVEADTSSSRERRQKTAEEKAARKAKKKRSKATKEAEKALGQRNYDMAAAAYTEAIECGHMNDQTRSDLHFGRARCWLQLGQVEKAAADVKAAEELKPDPMLQFLSSMH